MRVAALFSILSFLPSCAGRPAHYDLSTLESAERRIRVPVTPTETPLQQLLSKEELSIEEVLQIAELRSPQLAFERRNIDLATAAIWEAQLYPNPTALFQLEDYGVRGGRFGSSNRTAGISIPIVLSGRIEAATRVAECEREVAALTYIWNRRQILGEVAHAFIELLAARTTLEITTETREIARRLHQATEERFRAETIPEMEILKAAVSLAQSETDVRIAERTLTIALKTLHAAMGDAEEKRDNFRGDLRRRFVLPTLEVLRERVQVSHPLTAAAAKRKEAAQLSVDLARAERIPDPQLEVTAGADVNNEAIVQAGVSVTIPIFNRNQAKIAQAEIQVQQAAFHLHAVRNDLVLRLTSNYETVTAAQERVAVYTDEILPKAQKALEQTEEGNRVGKFRYLDVLDAQRTLAEARSAYAAALAELNLSVAELEKITGQVME